VGQAASNKTIIIIAASSGAGFIALVGCIVWAKSRLNRRMHDYHAKKRLEKKAGTGPAAAPTGVVPAGTRSASASTGAPAVRRGCRCCLLLLLNCCC
jgi:hypothetical protein